MRTALMSNRLNWIVALLGLWQILAPFVLGYSNITYALYNAVAVGVLLIVFAVWSIRAPNVSTASTLNWINVILVLWLIAAPYVLGYSAVDRAVVNTLIVGIAVVVLEILATMTMRRQITVHTEEPVSHPV